MMTGIRTSESDWQVLPREEKQGRWLSLNVLIDVLKRQKITIDSQSQSLQYVNQDWEIVDSVARSSS